MKGNISERARRVLDECPGKLMAIILRGGGKITTKDGKTYQVTTHKNLPT